MIYRIIVLTIFVLSLLISCGEDSSTNSSKSIEIKSISPNTGKARDLITISGVNFGIVQDTSYITFNNIIVKNITFWSDKEIKLIVPLYATSGKVSVTVNSIKSNEVDFTVLEPDPMEPVIIGSQTWMKRNLDVSTYRNGESIRHTESLEDWLDAGEKKEGAWCYYNNDPDIGAVYGKLYNWYAVNDPRGLAPVGWHVPTDDELALLTDYLGGKEVAAGKMKEADTTHWFSPNTGGINSSGFTALPGGYLRYDGFRALRGNCFLWSATEIEDKGSWCRFLVYIRTDILRTLGNKIDGYSVRCVKD